MSQNAKPPHIPPLKLSLSEEAVIRGRPLNITPRHAPAIDDTPDPQGGGESSRQEHSSADKRDEQPQSKPSTATGRSVELNKSKTAETQKCVAVKRSEQTLTQGDKNMKEAKSRTTSRVRELISQFDTTTHTATRPSKLPTRGAKKFNRAETAKCDKAKSYDSSGNITPRDDSDLDTCLLDASDYTDSSISGLLPSEEEDTNQNSRTHTTRCNRQTEENETSNERQQPAAKIIRHHRNRSASAKSRLTPVGNSPKERTPRSPKERTPRSQKSRDGPHSFVSNTPITVTTTSAVDAYDKQSCQPVLKLETPAPKDLTVREAISGSKRTSHVDHNPRQQQPTSSTKIQAKWDGSPAIGGPSIRAPRESSRSRNRTLTHRKLVVVDVAKTSCDSAIGPVSTDQQQPEEQDTTAGSSLIDPLLQPLCGATHRPVEPSETTIGADNHQSDHHPFNRHSIVIKLKRGPSYFLSPLLEIPPKALILLVVVATWIVRLLRAIPVRSLIRSVRWNSDSCPRPSSPQQLLQPERKSRRKLLIQGGILMIVLLCCYAFLAIDFCQIQ